MTAAGLELVLYADATSETGAGHAMRLATLGAAWQASGGTARAVGSMSLPFVVDRFARLGIPVLPEWPDPADVVVVDSYDPAVRFQCSERSRAKCKAVVDDVGGTIPPGFQVVWNPNAYGSVSSYPEFVGLVLAGIDALAIREDLTPWRGEQGGEIVVSLGGTLPPAHVAEALELLGELCAERRFAITGPWTPNGWRRIAPGRFWNEAVDAAQLVLAAGITVWEAAAVGIPVILLQTVENQRLVYRWARDSGVPGLNTMLLDGEFLAHQLRALLPAATLLPKVTSGAPRVAARLAQLAREVPVDP